MDLVVRAFPLAEGKITDLHEFGRCLLAEKREQTDNFFSKLGVSRECWYMQEIERKQWVIVVTLLRDADPAFQNYGDSMEEFDVWYKKQVRELTGVDVNETPKGPLSKCVFEWGSS